MGPFRGIRRWMKGESRPSKPAAPKTEAAGTAYKKGDFIGKPYEVLGVLGVGGFSVIPHSGTFRNLAKELDFIIGRMPFRILLLLPIHPPPTTYARMGRFGSPYAGQCQCSD